jgi:hypothetical protein
MVRDTAKLGYTAGCGSGVPEPRGRVLNQSGFQEEVFRQDLALISEPTLFETGDFQKRK